MSASATENGGRGGRAATVQARRHEEGAATPGLPIPRSPSASWSRRFNPAGEGRAVKGDFIRLAFHPTKHYTSVRLQQGRVLPDADWSEQAEILADSELPDIVGARGVPSACGLRNPGQPPKRASRSLGRSMWSDAGDGVPRGRRCVVERRCALPRRTAISSSKTISIPSRSMTGHDRSGILQVVT